MTRKQSELDGASDLARSGTSSLPNQAAMHDHVDRQASWPSVCCYLFYHQFMFKQQQAADVWACYADARACLNVHRTLPGRFHGEHSNCGCLSAAVLADMHRLAGSTLQWYRVHPVWFMQELSVRSYTSAGGDVGSCTAAWSCRRLPAKSAKRCCCNRRLVSSRRPSTADFRLSKQPRKT